MESQTTKLQEKLAPQGESTGKGWLSRTDNHCGDTYTALTKYPNHPITMTDWDAGLPAPPGYRKWWSWKTSETCGAITKGLVFLSLDSQKEKRKSIALKSTSET